MESDDPLWLLFLLYSALGLNFSVLPLSGSGIIEHIPISLSFSYYFLALMSRSDLKLGNRLNSASAFHILL